VGELLIRFAYTGGVLGMGKHVKTFRFDGEQYGKFKQVCDVGDCTVTGALVSEPHRTAMPTLGQNNYPGVLEIQEIPVFGNKRLTIRQSYTGNHQIKLIN
jgi:hypothetical protein